MNQSTFDLKLNQTGSMKHLDNASAHQIHANQCIQSLSMAVKELIENSLDASALNIRITVRNYGKDSIECWDDGSGIDKSQFSSVALGHHTSKLRSIEQLSDLNTYGFRGEALNSLCSISSSVAICTCTKPPLASFLQLDSEGRLAGENTTTRDSRGTTVTVKELFKRLPVRWKHWTKTSFKREWIKCIAVVMEYSLVVSDNVSLSLENITNGENKKEIINCRPNPNLKKFQDESLPEFVFESLKYSIMTVFGLRFFKSLTTLHLSNSTPSKYSNKGPRMEISGYISFPGQGRSAPDRQFFSLNRRPCSLPKWNRLINEVFRRNHPTQYPCFILRLKLEPGSFDINVTPDKRVVLLHSEQLIYDWFKDELTEFANRIEGSFTRDASPHFKKPRTSVSSLSPVKFDLTDHNQQKSRPKISPKFILTKNLFLSVRTRKMKNIGLLPKSYNQYYADFTEKSPEGCSFQVPEIDDERAEAEVKRRISKQDFEKMKIIGQFNKGFILAYLADDNFAGKNLIDLFIIDQHASDEKFLFEKYLNEMKIQSQPLVNPIELQLSPSQSNLVLSHFDMFAFNGFKIDKLRSKGNMIYILSLPVLNGKTMGLSEFEELLNLYEEVQCPSTKIKVSKVRETIASKACRAAWMIGDSLTMSQMRIIVDNLGLIDHPWNCPHGRPSIRWIRRLNGM